MPSSRLWASGPLGAPDADADLFSDRARPYAALVARRGARAAMHRLRPEARAALWTEGLSPRDLFGAPSPAPDGPPDVLVIGAGLAGLVAAQRVARAGLTPVVLEARRRLGGRALGRDAPGGRLDLGGAWLHDAEHNPLTEVARRLGLRLRRDHAPRFLVGAPDAPARAGAQLEAAAHALGHAWVSAGARADGAASLMPAPAVSAVARALAGPLSMGVEAAEISTRDYATMRGEDGALLIEEGAAALVDALSIGLDVRLGAPVTDLRSTADGVQVWAGERLWTARAAILTVPPALVAQAPWAAALPAAKRDAAAALPMGRLEKVVLALPPEVDSPACARWHHVADPAVELVIRPMGRPVAIGFAGGDAARRSTLAERVARVQAVLQATLGVASAEVIAATDWGGARYSGGAYSAARPGRQSARRAWAAPVAERLFFAGEAADERWAQCLPGAYRTGLRAAEEVVAAVGSARRRVA